MSNFIPPPSYSSRHKQHQKDADSETDNVIPSDITKKILKVAKDQLVEEDFVSEGEGSGDESVSDFGGPENGEEYIDADSDYEEDDEEVQQEYARDQNTVSGMDSRAHQGNDTDLPAEVVEHYTRIGKFLSVYTVGKVPKGFKILPTRKQWEELLYYTNPVEWTPHAHYQATKIFASNLNDNLAQWYYNLVLLPAIRSDIKEHKKLHFQLYQALKKAMFKPLAFMKGILLPLSDATDCTLREAVIVGSVLSKMTVPMAFGAAALYKLCVTATKWTPVKSVLITILLNKKYSLPTAVVEGLVAHFESFTKLKHVSKLPVLWHNSLLTFAQRYKDALTPSQQQRLMDVTTVHSHLQISPEIRRELNEKSMVD
jgi:essential nuclear protein 1